MWSWEQIQDFVYVNWSTHVPDSLFFNNAVSVTFTNTILTNYLHPLIVHTHSLYLTIVPLLIFIVSGV